MNGCSPSRGVITGLPFNRCCSLGFRKRLFCPVNEVYRASVTRFITMSPSHEANEESRHDQKVRPSPLVWLSFTGKALVYGWFSTYKSVVHAAGKDEGSSTSLTDLRLQRKRKTAARMSNMRLSRENEPPVKQLCHEDAGDNQVSSKRIFTAYNG